MQSIQYRLHRGEVNPFLYCQGSEGIRERRFWMLLYRLGR